MANDLVTRSLQLITGSAKSFGSEYVSNIMDLKSDAEQIKDALIADSKTPMSAYKKIKSNGVLKSVSGWFNDKNNETSDEDEFDSGFISDSNDDSNMEITSNDVVMSTSKNQINALYQIGSKQNEAAMANTAEIVSTFNNRSSELLTSVNNINTTLNKISSQMGTMIELYGNNSINEAKYRATSSFVGSDGKLSLSEIFNTARGNVKNSTALQYGSIFAQMIQQGTKEDAVGLLGQMLFGDKKIGVLGNRSINEIGKGFNELVGNVAQTAMSEMIASKPFKKLFGDLNETTPNRDYSQYINNQYNNKPAQLDGMFRYSVINVIPQYLKELVKGVTGKTFNVTSQGQLSLTANSDHEFDKVTRSAFSQSGLSYNATSSITEDVKAVDIDISSSDVADASKALTMTYVMYLHNKGIRTLRPSQLSADDTSVIERAVQSLSYASGKPASYWTPVCMAIMQKVSSTMTDRSTFVSNVNARLNSMVNEAMQFANTSNFSYQATNITSSMADEQFKRDYQANHDIKPTNNVATDVKSVNTNTTNLTTSDYVKNIFGILNRGINVHVTGNKRYAPYKGIMKVGVSSPGSSSSDDNDNATPNNVSVSNDESYMSKMFDKLIPKGIRTSMQFFAQNLGISNSDNPEDSILSKTKKLFSPVTDKAKELGNVIAGTKTTDETTGQTKRTGGVIQAVGNKVKSEMNNIGVDIKSSLDDTIAKTDYNHLRREVAGMKPTDSVSAQDQMIAQQVFASMQTAMSNGDGADDLSEINALISSISDSSLKNRLQRSVGSMITRNSNKDVPKASLAGKIITKVLFGVKKVFSPITKILGSLLRVVTGIGGKVGKLIMGGLKSGARDLTTGVSNMTRGFFGQKARYDEDGNEIQPGSTGMISKLTIEPIKKQIEGFKLIADKFKESISGLGGTIKSIGTNIKSIITTKLEPLGEKIKTAGESIKNGIGSFLGGIKDKLPFGNKNKDKEESGIFKSEFMKGFTSVFEETAAKKEKDRLKNMKPETVADVKSSGMLDMMSGKTASLLSKFVDIGNSIVEKLDGINETATEIKDGDKEDDKSKQSTATLVQPETPTPKVTNTGNVAEMTTGDTPEIDIGGTTAGAMGATTGTAGATTGTATAKKGKFGFDLGKIAGGFTSALLGLGKIILTVVASLEGFKALTQIVENIFKDGLQPLNKAFNHIIEILKPIVKTVTQIVTVIAESITKIVDVLIDVIQPIIEAIQPIIETVLEVLQPILDMLTGLVNVIMAPLAGIIQAVIVPIVRHIGNSLEVLMGIVQIGMGSTLTILGGILTGIGTIIKWLTGKTDILNTADKLKDSGKDMITNGTASVKSGISKEVQLVKETLSGEIFETDKTDETETKKITTTKSSDNVTSGGSVMDGVVNNGSTNTTTATPVYGSGNVSLNQSSYTANNMSSRGCGPIALADAYARRTGNVIRPDQLVNGMNSRGSYDPNRGTSVSSFVNTGRSLGMNMQVGGVDRQSLKTASPNNPITVLGSGTSYGTRSGNNHYVNVVGTDKAGGAYVLNPLNGKVHRTSSSGLLSGAKLGIYGSGDSEYKFSEETTSAMDELKNITGQILSMFTGQSKSDKIQSTIDAEKEKETIRNVRVTNGDDEFEKQENVDAAFALFQKANPKRDGESDVDYEKRFKFVRDKYIAMASIEKTRDDQSDKLIAFRDDTSDSANTFQNTMQTLIENIKNNAATNPEFATTDSSSSTTYNGSNGVMKSDNGVVLGTQSYTPEITETDMTVPSINGGSNFFKSPLHEFFKHMSNDAAYTEPGGFFGNRNNQDKNGRGTVGDSHQGVDINTTNDSNGTIKVIATTDGKVVGTTVTGSMGNSVSWEDAAGNRHRVMHMNDVPLVKTNDMIKGGETQLGYIGNTGYSSGYHVHYDIKRADGSVGPNEVTYKGEVFTNPMTYWKYRASPTPTTYTGTQRPITLTNTMADESAWNAYKNKPGMKSFFDAAKRANLSPAQTAIIASTGIWEDSAKKLMGEKSLTHITYDYNGQPAVGIMNWIPNFDHNGEDTEFGSTVEDQLKHIEAVYFNDNSADERALAKDPFRSGYNWGDVYKEVTGRPTFNLKVGEHYGSYMTRDLLEGGAQYTGTAVVPGGFVTKTGMAQRLGTAAEAYNWMLQNGYGNGDVSTNIPSLDSSIIQGSIGSKSAFKMSNDSNTINYNNITDDSSRNVNPVIINKYDIRQSSEDRSERLRRILTNTYNVREEKVEELLERILAILENSKTSGNNTVVTKNKTSQQSSMFDENGIPSQLVRLYQ